MTPVCCGYTSCQMFVLFYVHALTPFKGINYSIFGCPIKKNTFCANVLNNYDHTSSYFYSGCFYTRTPGRHTVSYYMQSITVCRIESVILQELALFLLKKIERYTFYHPLFSRTDIVSCSILTITFACVKLHYVYNVF